MSAILYILIATVAMVIILQAGIPLLNKMKDRTTYTKIKDTMQGLDQQIEDIASEGSGSQRVIPIEVRGGNVKVEGEKLTWQLETKTAVIEPRSKMDFGNLDIYSNIDVSNEETNYSYILENSRIKVNISKFDNEEITTSEIINEIVFKENSEVITGGFEFSLTGCSGSDQGFATTEMNPPTNNPKTDSASVIVHMKSNGAACYGSYDLVLTLDSFADFIKVDLKNLK